MIRSHQYIAYYAFVTLVVFYGSSVIALPLQTQIIEVLTQEGHSLYSQRVFKEFPLRTNSKRALRELYASEKTAAKLRWDKQDLQSVSFDFEQALRQHGLEVLNPLAKLFAEPRALVIRTNGDTTENVRLSANLINILDRFLHGHLLREPPRSAINRSGQVNALKAATVEFFNRHSIKEFLTRLRPDWPLYSPTTHALHNAQMLLSILEDSNAPMAYGDCSRRVDAFAKTFDLFGFGSHKEMTATVQHVIRRQIMLFTDNRSISGKHNNTLFKMTSIPCFYDAMYQAVQSFQHHISLQPTGILNKLTIAHLRSTLRDWINTLIINLDRMRWRPLNQHGPILLVNIPDFSLHAFESGISRLSMKVVVGKRSHPTPRIEDALQSMVFAPSWWVPKSIAQNEIVPLVRIDPHYLERYNFTAFLHDRPISGKELSLHSKTLSDPIRGVSVIQQPGIYNVLGKVKFVVPGSDGIYLHDTPDKTLFQQDNRSFSHGCIRVEHPEKLAHFVASIRQLPINVETIFRQMDFKRTKAVAINPPIPILAVYWTVQMNSQGAVSYAPDLYQYDQEEIKSFYGSSSIK